MEISFSSERDDYEDDPTAQPSRLNPRSQAAAPPPPPASASTWASSSAAKRPTENKLPPVNTTNDKSHASKKPGGFFSSFGSSSTAAPKGSSAAPPKSAVAAPTSETETVQAFDPADMERSISRRESISSMKKKKEKKSAAAAIMEHRPEAAPGAIDDDSDRSHHDTATKANKSALSSVKLDGGIVVGSGANRSMIDGMGRKGGKGAFSLAGELDFSSDEEEEGAKPAQRRRKDEKSKDKDKDASSGSKPSRPAVQSDVAPLINEVAFDFVQRRWLSTILGGMQFTWSAQSSDDHMPGLPAKFIIAQVGMLIYPAIVAIIFNALRYYDVIDQIGIAALIAGAIGFLMHLLIHSLHHRLLGAAPVSTSRVGDSSTPAGGDGPAAGRLGVDGGKETFELELQKITKARAHKNGTLPKPKTVEKKKPDAVDEDEEDASLPPGVQRKRVMHDDVEGDGDSTPIDPNTPTDLSLFDSHSCRFLLGPTPKSWSRILLHGVFVGGLLAGACHFLDWSFIARQYDSSNDISTNGIIYLVFAWISFCIGFYSLNIRSPVELNKYSDDDLIEEELNRPFFRSMYLTSIIVFNLVLRVGYSGSHASDLSPIAIDVHDVLMIIFPILPAIFAIGVLPPIDALLWWASETITEIFFSVTPRANATRTMTTLILHTIGAVITFLVWMYESHSAAMLFSLGSSFLLAWNLLPMHFGSSSMVLNLEAGNPDVPFPSSPEASLYPLRFSTFIKLILGFGCWGIGMALSRTNTDLIDELRTLREGDIAFDVIALVLACIIFGLSELYQPYLCFGQIRNPFYKTFVLETEKQLRETPSLVRRSIWKHDGFAWVVRAFLIVYVAYHQESRLFLKSDGDDDTSMIDLDDHSRVRLFAYSVLLLRCFNQIWSDHFQALVHLLFVVVINQIAGHALDTQSWTNLDWTVRYMIAGYVWARFRYDLLPKVWFIIVLTHSTFTVPKLAMRHPKVMKAICILLIPYHLAIVLLSSFLGTPILPFLGSPIFLLAFPRPSRIWHSYGGRYGMNDSSGAELENGGKDTLFYQQQFPGIYQSLQHHLRTGVLTYTLGTGDFFLLRSEPYLIWCCILERGLGYVVVQMKGLELQTTSCHTVEALNLDENIDNILDSSNSRPFRNPLGISHTYTPLLELRGIKSFSITKNVLTGIIDDLGNIKLLQRAFMRKIMVDIKTKIDEVIGLHSLPSHWLKPTVSNYDLQQLEEAQVWSQAYYEYLYPDFASIPSSDQALFKRICMSLYALVETLSPDVVSGGGRITPAHILKTFEGRLESSLYSDYILAPTPAALSLKQVVLDAYRVSVKSMYDCAALGSLEILSEDTPEQFDEWHTLLREYQQDWYIGMVKENTKWEELVTKGEKKMFAIAKATNETNKYTSLTLEMSSNMSIKLCRLSSTVIRSFWCSLSLELYYFANDDDESFSRQAHPWLLRNLTLQTSEPPLGYPVFSGIPTIIKTN